MIDETTNGPVEPTSERVAFCQDCGKPLTKDTIRPVGTGVFCEPCLEARVGAGQAPAGSATTAGSVPPPPTGQPYATPYGQPYTSGIPTNSPSPGMAGLLAIIPGVGAFYNGQYAKGLAIFAIFAILGELSHMEFLGWAFGLGLVAWWIYQIVDAHHTARAKREGLPLPDPFGLNDIGERLGFGKNWGTSAHTSANPAAGSTTPPPSSWSTPPVSGPASSGSAAWSTVPPATAGPVPPMANNDWVGYVPPTAFGAGAVRPATPYPDPASNYADNLTAHVRQTASAAGFHQAPYTETYTGTAAGAGAVTPTPAPLPVRRFPVGAVILIGVGVLLLLGNVLPMWRLNASAMSAIVLLAVGVWVLIRRLGYAGGVVYPGSLISSMRAPVVLLTLALIFGLQALDIATVGQTWALLLLAVGAVMLIERTMGSRSMDYMAGNYTGTEGYPASVVPPVSGSGAVEDSSAKGGQ